jgi:ketosteroid isomerase-like protein
MPISPDALAADQQFFDALLAGAAAALEQLLADDFVLIDVMGGSEIPRAVLIELVGSGQLRFETIEPAERRVRRYGTTAIVTGRTRMTGRFGATAFTAASRYTHVFVEHARRWRLVAAQGTPIVEGDAAKA